MFKFMIAEDIQETIEKCIVEFSQLKAKKCHDYEHWSDFFDRHFITLFEPYFPLQFFQEQVELIWNNKEYFIKYYAHLKELIGDFALPKYPFAQQIFINDVPYLIYPKKIYPQKVEPEATSYVADGDEFWKVPLLPLEGFYPRFYLIIFARMLFTLLVKLKHKSLNNKLDKHLTEKYLVIQQELVVTINSIIVTLLMEMANRNHVSFREIANVIFMHLLRLKENEEISIGTGFVGHALYLSLLKKENLIIRVDNGGAGCFQYHEYTVLVNKKGKQNLCCHPVIIGSFSLNELENNRERIISYLESALQAKFQPEKSALAALYKKLNENKPDNWKELFPARPIQMVGNCVVHNHKINLHYRLHYHEAVLKLILRFETQFISLADKKEHDAVEIHDQSTPEQVRAAPFWQSIFGEMAERKLKTLGTKLPTHTLIQPLNKDEKNAYYGLIYDLLHQQSEVKNSDYSKLTLFLDFPLSLIRDILENIIPFGQLLDQWFEKKFGRVDVDLKLWVTRTGAITLRGENGQLFLSFPLHVDATVKKAGLHKSVQFDFTPKIVCTLGIDEDLKTIFFVALDNIIWDNKPEINVLGISITFASWSQELIENALQPYLNNINEKIQRKFNLKQSIEKLWNKLQKPIEIINYPSFHYFFYFLPYKLSQFSLETTQDSLRFNFELLFSCAIQQETSQINFVNLQRALPAPQGKTIQANSPQFNAALGLNLPVLLIRDVLEAAIPNGELWNDWLAQPYIILWGLIDIRIKLWVTRTGPVVLNGSNNQLHLSFPVQVTITGEKAGIHMDIKLALTPKITCIFEIAADLKTTFQLGSVIWDETPAVEFHFPLIPPISISFDTWSPSLIESIIKPIIDQTNQDLKTQFNFKEWVEKVWHQLQKPIKLLEVPPQQYFFYFTPKQINDLSLTITDDVIRFNFWLSFMLAIKVDESLTHVATPIDPGLSSKSIQLQGMGGQINVPGSYHTGKIHHLSNGWAALVHSVKSIISKVPHKSLGSISICLYNTNGIRELTLEEWSTTNSSSLTSALDIERRHLIVTNASGIKVWDLVTRRCERTINDPPAPWFHQVLPSSCLSNNRFVLICLSSIVDGIEMDGITRVGMSGVIKVWNWKTGVCERQDTVVFDCGGGLKAGVLRGEAGEQIVYVSADKTFRVIDLKTGISSLLYDTGPPLVHAMSVLPNNDIVFVTSQYDAKMGQHNATLQILNFQTKQCRKSQFQLPPSRYPPNFYFFVTLSNERLLFNNPTITSFLIWNIVKSKLEYEIEFPAREFFWPEVITEQQFVSYSQDGKIRLHDLKDLSPISAQKQHQSQKNLVPFAWQKQLSPVRADQLFKWPKQNQNNNQKKIKIINSEWATDSGINQILRQHLINYAHVIDPAISSISNPFEHEDGIITYGEIINGYSRQDGTYEAGRWAEEPKKPLVMVINTTGADRVFTNPALEVGSHWVACLILPSRYSIAGETFMYESTRVITIDSLGNCRLPDSFKNMLREGKNYDVTLDGGIVINRHMPALGGDIEFLDIAAGQQNNAIDCGWWATYNALMVILTGGTEFLNRFANLISAVPLRNMFPNLSQHAIGGANITPLTDAELIAQKTRLRDLFLLQQSSPNITRNFY